MNKRRSKRFGKGKSFRRIYLIAPHHPNNFWTMQGAVDIIRAKTLMPNAALATLIALTDDDIDVEYVLCDENVSNIDWNMPYDLVAITGGTIHEKRIRELCLTFKEKGKQIALGGSFASINHDQCGGIADYLFIGVETVREKSLEEVHNAHNAKYDIAERIKRISRYGIIPFIGLIVGFDNDDLTIFEDLYQFIENTYSPIAGISLLNAPKKTPLHERLKKEGRL